MYYRLVAVSLCLFMLTAILPSFTTIKAEAAIGQQDFLKANGSVIRNQYGSGEIVNLRGTNLGGWLLQEEWMSPSGAVDEYTFRRVLTNRFGEAGMQSLIDTYRSYWIQESDLDTMKQLGMNVLRVPFYWEDFMRLDGTMKPDEVAFKHLDWIINESAKRDMYVILDFHGVPGAACPWHSCGQEGTNHFWSNATYQEWTKQIWVRIATRYNGNPAVAAYDLLNEPLVTMGAGENSSQIAQKMSVYNDLYQAVRAVDSDHIIVIAAFFDWYAAYPPEVYNWSNVIYQVHNYVFDDWFNYNFNQSEINRWIADFERIQREWNVPIYTGEFSFDYNNLYEQWLMRLNDINVSWTNWSYKVRGGGNWGYFNNNIQAIPDLYNDSQATIAQKWSRFTTNNFNANTDLQDLVARNTTTPPVQEAWFSIQAVANDRYVSADNYGNNPLVANRTNVGDWEKFKVVENSDGTISLLSRANQKYVQVNLNDGAKLRASSSQIQSWEKFERVDLGNGTYGLRSLANNQYVSTDLNQATPQLAANRSSIGGAWEAFVITQVEGGNQSTLWRSIQAGANNRYVSADNYGNNQLVANRDSVGDWELFRVIENRDGTISLLAKANYKYVQADADNNNRLIANGNKIALWEKFDRSSAGNAMIALRARVNNQYVTTDLNQSTPTLWANRSNVGGAWETFRIQ